MNNAKFTMKKLLRYVLCIHPWYIGFWQMQRWKISPKQAKKYLNSYLEFLSLPEENKAVADRKLKSPSLTKCTQTLCLLLQKLLKVLVQQMMNISQHYRRTMSLLITHEEVPSKIGIHDLKQ